MPHVGLDIGRVVTLPVAPVDEATGNTHPDHNLRFECHVSDWILAVSSLLQWHQWMKQPEMPRHQVVKSQYAVQWLMRNVANVCPRQTGMGNNTIKTHLALHLCEDILDHGVPDNVNSAYAESAHIPLAKMTSRNTQKRAVSFTKQAAHRYVENLAVTLASADVANDVKLMGSRLDTPSPTAAPVDAQPSGVMAGRQFTISWTTGEDSATFSWNRKGPSDDPDKDRLPSPVTEYLSEHCLPHMPNGKLPCFTEFVSVRDDLYCAIQTYMTVGHGMITRWLSGTR